jgi:hypothetical protein
LTSLTVCEPERPGLAECSDRYRWVALEIESAADMSDARKISFWIAFAMS